MVIEDTENLFMFCIKEWNWVDDDGNALPLPSQNPEILDDLTDDETVFIMEKVMGSPVETREKKES